MKFVSLLLPCLAFALVEPFKEREFLEDENDPGQHYIIIQCNKDADCGDGKCCLKKSNVLHTCNGKRKEGGSCEPDPCNVDADCGDGKCCLKVSSFGTCMAKRKEGRFCDPDLSCFFSCQDDLECRKTKYGFFSRCMRPEEPGFGEDK